MRDAAASSSFYPFIDEKGQPPSELKLLVI
jgi:hypothetical protein